MYLGRQGGGGRDRAGADGGVLELEPGGHVTWVRASYGDDFAVIAIHIACMSLMQQREVVFINT